MKVTVSEIDAEIGTRRVRLADDSTMGVALNGPTEKAEILYIHGFLGCRLEAFIGGHHDVGIIAIDRPGYGLSDPVHDLSLATFGQRIAELMRHLGSAGPLTVVGSSAGGPYAIAAASALSERVRRLVLLGAVGSHELVRAAPYPMRLLRIMDERVWLRGMVVPPLRGLLAGRLTGRRAIELLLADERPGFATHGDFERMIERMRANVAQGLGSGDHGVRTDFRMLSTAWDVRPSDIACPVTVIHSLTDRIVGPEHARWYEKVLPRARLRLVDELGHLASIIAGSGEIVPRYDASE